MWQRWSGQTYPRTHTGNFSLTLSFYSLSIYLSRIKCLNVIFLEICEAWELVISTDVFRHLSGTHKVALPWAQAGSPYIYFTCISALLGTAVIAPWKGLLWATAERVDSNKGSWVSRQGMPRSIWGISDDRVPLGPRELRILHPYTLEHLPIDRKVQFLYESQFQILVN